jgi:tetratricopeptide (TPR) repeat protein
LCAGLLALSGCANLWPQTAQLREALPQGLPERVELVEVPFFPQTEYQCGPAALATVLASSGVQVTPEDGLVSYQLAPRLDDLLRELAAGTPVILLQNLGFSDGWHYAVAVGYDYARGEVILRSGVKEREVLPFTVNELVWKRSGYWAMVAMPPGRIPATADEQRWLSAIAALERTGNAVAARTAYSGFLKRWPDNVNAAIGLANAHHVLGALTEAEGVLRKAARRDPESVIILNNLAQTLSDQGRHAEALPLIERAAAAGGPFYAAVAETRATIRKRLGKSD